MSTSDSTANGHNNEAAAAVTAAAVPEYDPSKLPPLDVAWHVELIQRLGKQNKAVREDANASLDAFAGSMRSPLQVMDPVPCQDLHGALVQCMEGEREKLEKSGALDGNGSDQMWRQNLALASSGSARHVSSVEQMTASIPDRMPKSKTGSILRHSGCMKIMEDFRKCSADAAHKFYSTLETVQRRANESKAPELPHHQQQQGQQ